MKKCLILLIFILNLGSYNAQYIKLPLDKNHFWRQSSSIHKPPAQFSSSGYILKVTADTTINGRQYKCISNDFLRQDTVNKLVIAYTDGHDRILYNFNKNVGDTISVYNPLSLSNITDTVISKDSVLLGDGIYHRRFIFKDMPGPVIEGVGSLAGLLTPWWIFEGTVQLDCMTQVSPSVSIYNRDGVGCILATGIASNTVAKKETFVYPNPASGLVNIKTGSTIPRFIEIRNILGQSLLRLTDVDHETVSVEIVGLRAGLYFVEVYYEDGFVCRPFVKD